MIICVPVKTTLDEPRRYQLHLSHFARERHAHAAQALLAPEQAKPALQPAQPYDRRQENP